MTPRPTDTTDFVHRDVDAQIGHLIQPRAQATASGDAVQEGVQDGFAVNMDVHGADAGSGPAAAVALRRHDAPIEVVAWRWTGIHSASVFGEAPTGMPVTVRGVTFVHTGDETVIRHIDWLGLAAQLGLQLTGRSTKPLHLPSA